MHRKLKMLLENGILISHQHWSKVRAMSDEEILQWVSEENQRRI